MKKKNSIKKVTAVLMALAMAIVPCITGFGPVFAAEEPEDQEKYTVTLNDVEHGQLKFKGSDERKRSYEEKDLVQIEVKPEDGYRLKTFTLQVDGSEDKVEDTSGGDSFTFNMPAGNITLTGNFEKDDSSKKTVTKATEGMEPVTVSVKGKGTVTLSGEYLEEDIVLKGGESKTFQYPAHHYILAEAKGETDAGITTRVVDENDYEVEEASSMDGTDHYRELSIVEGMHKHLNVTFGSAKSPRAISLFRNAKSGSEAQPEVGDVFSGSGTVTSVSQSHEGGTVSNVKVKLNSGILSSMSLNTDCAQHGAAAPEIGDKYNYTYTVTSVNKTSGLVKGNFYAKHSRQPAITGVPHSGYQAISGRAGIYREYNGFVKLQKSSANTTLVAGNSCYSLESAKYGVYSDKACKTLVGTLTTDAKGISNALEIPIGTYYVKETQAPKGYYKDDKVYTVGVYGSQTSLVKVTDKPGNDPMTIKINKIDEETGGIKTQGAASLEGAQFTVKYYDGYYTKDTLPEKATRTWVLQTKEIKNPNSEDVTYFCSLNEKYKVSGDDFYYASGNPDPTLPLGTVTVEETKAPNGYKLDGAFLKAAGSTEKIEGVYLSTITMNSDGLTGLNGGNEYSMSDRVIRGDFELTKADEENQERMANIPFKITSNTTGESHQFVTDENGYYNSSSEFNKHSQDTNGGKKDSGLWFGLNEDGKNVEVNDKYGALPYDTYTLEELRCAANEDKALYKGTFTVSRDGFQIDLGTIDNPDLTLETKALDEKTGTHFACADEEVTIIDTVSYTGLKKGKEHVLTGTVMNRETGEALLDKDGNPITATKKFKPKTAEGEVEVEFTFDASQLKGATLTVFEELTLDGEMIAEHKDLNDAGQTVRIPEIGTQAKDSDTENDVSKADKEVTIIDTVSYSNLKEGKKYTVKGTLMDQKTGKPVVDAKGQQITSEASFVAESSSGTVDVKFTFDGSNLQGETIVVFEKLYYGEKLLAVHTDIEDESQTIIFPWLKTTATDVDSNTKNALADEQITIKDVVEYKNLIPGQEYTLKGVIMDKETGKPLQAKSSVATETEFHIPEGALEFDFKTGTYVLVPELNEEVPAGLYLEKEKGFELVMPLMEPEQAEAEEELYEVPEELITWTHTFEKQTKGYILDGKVTLKPEPQYSMSDKKKDVTSEVTFIPEKSEGKVEVSFVFDGSAYAGQTLVVFEDLFMDDKSVGEHKDLKDTDQTIYLPGLHTTATDQDDGDKQATADDKVTIVDKVDYTNLIPGQTYKVEGTLMDKTTGTAILVDGKEVKTQAEFKAEERNGSVLVAFTFDASKLGGKDVVVFEKLYGADGKELANHEDLGDEGQTVKLVKVPVKGRGKVQTGDNLLMYALIGGGVVLLGVGSYLVFKKKKK